ncbi:hypothetical protein NPIL_295931 [Nephila pilipes]|uniref:Uncharacterized protein n=1 Tax=Nephila pilipes TaxID=299642 RepID=A0A8X6PGE1_NEPPI|nr:hypothetical protein NPIL_295931 [Nephila pilipes]
MTPVPLLSKDTLLPESLLRRLYWFKLRNVTRTQNGRIGSTSVILLDLFVTGRTVTYARCRIKNKSLKCVGGKKKESGKNDKKKSVNGLCPRDQSLFRSMSPYYSQIEKNQNWSQYLL